ncbi:transporter substrate-binding domain-containing protein [Halovulum dunhuangense]|uniref:Transporter substrate-binding domain-containing protein n=1 Tax=Halovulum dunhuangense TaxID=1505036 RepID=A0A849L6F5_9RHOB|nr:transporter substrate-binding domain-containing protein [Halovulum dunhuangense]NNU82108.1 transporter substrate-binding domain-containing protein [Halovulum dunhuangense]
MYILNAGSVCSFIVLAATAAIGQEQAADKVRIGFRTDAAAFSAKVGDTHVGYTADLCRRLAPVLARGIVGDPEAYTFVDVETSDRFDAIRDGEVDLLCGVTTITRERRGFMNFTIPVFEDGVTVAVSSDAPEELLALTEEDVTHDDMIERIAGSGWTVGVLGGTTTAAFMENILLADLPAERVIRFDSHPEAFAALEEGTLDAYFVSRGVAKGHAETSGRKVVLRRDPLTYEPIAIGVAREHQDLLLLADVTLSDWIFAGSLEEIHERHFGEMGDDTREFLYKAALQ